MTVLNTTKRQNGKTMLFFMLLFDVLQRNKVYT